MSFVSCCFGHMLSMVCAAARNMNEGDLRPGGKWWPSEGYDGLLSLLSSRTDSSWIILTDLLEHDYFDLHISTSV